MKTGNTLRTAKNSLLCFFMALAGGFLVACGGDGVRFTGGGGTPTPMTVAMTVIAPSSPGVPTVSQPDLPAVNISVYLHDTAAEGVAYSGPTGNGVTGKGGVFLASEGEFEFSIGGTTLGRVSLNSEWADNAVTPADFMGVVDDPQVITIARIMQALDLDLDENGMQVAYTDRQDRDLQNGISISQAAREDTRNLFTLIANGDASEAAIMINPGEVYDIPSADDAMNHLASTRKCLFSGGYVGDFEGLDNNGDEVSGQSYYAVEPFVNRVRRFTGAGNVNFESFVETSTVGVTGSAIVLDQSNMLSFNTPRLVAGEWQFTDDSGDISSRTENLTLAAGTGNPGATRRIVGVETSNTVTVAGMYVLDYFEEATVFRGRYYEVDGTRDTIVSDSPLILTIAADGGSWASVAMSGLTTTLELIGTRGESGITMTIRIARENENYGSFARVFADEAASQLIGTWCDIGGAVGSTVAPMPPTPLIEIAVTWSEVSLATSYNLYRSTVSVGGYDQITQVDSDTTLYMDTPSAGANYFYHVQACNGTVCSEGPPQEDPAAGGGDGNGGDGDGDGNGGDGNGGDDMDDGMCKVGTELMVGQNCQYNEEPLYFFVRDNGDAVFLSTPTSEFGVVISRGSEPTIEADRSGRNINGVSIITFVATGSGTGGDTVWTITNVE